MEQANRKKMLLKTGRLHLTSRSFAFVGRKLVILTLALALCVSAFFTCARLSGLYILINEGLSLRCEYILQDASLSDMRLYFTEYCLQTDTRLQDVTYASYDISSYDYSLSFSNLKVWPWLNEISADITEKVADITGTSTDGTAPPPWAPLKYRITATKQNGKWLISSITVLDVNPKEQAAASPDPNASPLPMATATPKAVLKIQ